MLIMDLVWIESAGDNRSELAPGEGLAQHVSARLPFDG